MESTYREIAPSPRLAPFVECFWTGEVLEDFAARILPDGCADLLFISRNRRLVEAQLIGVMTRAHLVPLRAGSFLFGVRFNPGMAGVCLRRDIRAFNDRSPALQLVCGSAGVDLVRRLHPGASVSSWIDVVERWMNVLPSITDLHRAIGELVGRKGQLLLEDFAAVAGVGARQLRRTCLKHSGLAPKQLARVLRFRHAARRLRRGESDMTSLACDCGYYDQAHMIRDFRDLAGISPGRYLRQQVR